MMPFYETEMIKIYNADFIVVELPKESINLIITSPPYNLGVDYNTAKDDYSYDDYLLFTEKWLKKAYQLLKDDGRLCLNIPLDKNKNGQESVYADIITIAKFIGYKYHTTIIWNEQNISKRTAWGSFCSASAPYVIAPVEMIAVLYKKQWKRLQKGTSDISKEEFIAYTNGVWTFPGENRSLHPAPFPLELPLRCIKLFSYKEDTILDPFLGSGTTLLACLITGRKGIGVEINPHYCEIAKNRLLKQTSPQKERTACESLL